jgi:tRNA pseudouridine38-40 synthase
VSAPGERRLALLLEYDGSRYGGSQLQTNAASIQGELEAAIKRLTGRHSRAAFAGRTDAGVHALGQVAAFTTASRLATATIARGLNALLPPDIAVGRIIEAQATFDPRRHARRRLYRYVIYNAALRSPLWRDRAWHVAEPLDIQAMRRAAALLPGERDFAAFSRREPHTTTVRKLERCDVSRRGPLVTLEMQANAFLRQQVRRTAGTLAQVGRGRLAPDDVAALLEAPEPCSAGPVAPPQGLYLVAVSYPGLDLSPCETLSYMFGRAGQPPAPRLDR